jgi:hypothetical protein
MLEESYKLRLLVELLVVLTAQMGLQYLDGSLSATVNMLSQVDLSEASSSQ